MHVLRQRKWCMSTHCPQLSLTAEVDAGLLKSEKGLLVCYAYIKVHFWVYRQLDMIRATLPLIGFLLWSRNSGIAADQNPNFPRLRAQLVMREACVRKRAPGVQFCQRTGAGPEKYIIKPLSSLDTLLVIRSLNTLLHAAGLPLMGRGQRPLWTKCTVSLRAPTHWKAKWECFQFLTWTHQTWLGSS